MAQTRHNLEMGYRDANGRFHPVRASHDYDYGRANETDTGESSLLRSVAAAARRRAKRNPIQPGLFGDDVRVCHGCLAYKPMAQLKSYGGVMQCPSCLKKAQKKTAAKKQRALWDDQLSLFDNPNGFFYRQGRIIPMRGHAEYNEFEAGDFDSPEEKAKRKADNDQEAYFRELKRDARSWDKREAKQPQSKSKSKRLEKKLSGQDEADGLSLAQFVRSEGGIKWQDGNKRIMYYGELERLRSKQLKTSRLLNQHSRTRADGMREKADEAGYRQANGRRFSDVTSFIEAVEDDARGVRKFYPLYAAQQMHNPMKATTAGPKPLSPQTRKLAGILGVQIAKEGRGYKYHTAVGVFNSLTAAAEALQGNKPKTKQNGPLLAALTALDAVKGLRSAAKKENGIASKLQRAADIAKAAKSLKDTIRPPKKKKTNGSLDGAKQVYEMFQGRGPKKVVKGVAAPNGTPANVAKLGDLSYLKVRKGNRVQTYNFDHIVNNPDIDESAKPALCADKDGNLHILGDVATSEAPGVAGTIEKIGYITHKDHIGDGAEYDFRHKFGEEGGHPPQLIIDEEGQFHIKGGDYTLEAAGIVN